MQKLKNQSQNFEITHTDIILNSVNEGVFTVDENMVITYFNKAAEKITGISQEKAIGQFCFEVMRANICEKNCALKCSLQTGKNVIDKRVNVLRDDGKEFFVSINTSLLKDEKGNFIGGGASSCCNR